MNCVPDSKSRCSWEEAVTWLREQPQYRELSRHCFYDDPLVDAARRYAESNEWKAVRKILSGRKGLSLDVGAGRGISSYAMAEDGWKVVALDPDPSDIVGVRAIAQLSKHLGPGIAVVQATAERLPFAESVFDLVYCRASLHHAANLWRLCRELGRVLKPGGVFLATREHVVSDESDLTRFWESHPLHKLYGGEYAYRVEHYVDAIRRGGISLSRVFNPYSSDINLYPSSRNELRVRLAQRLKVPGALIPFCVIDAIGSMSKTPGRLYSFLGYKSSG